MLLKKNEEIVRVLEIQDDRRLVIGCTQKSMPVWISERDLEGYVPCDEAELSQDIPNFEGKVVYPQPNLKTKTLKERSLKVFLYLHRVKT